jgi:hypothetical protein
MDVKSLGFSQGRPKDQQCCIWAHRKEKCAAGPGKSDSVRLYCALEGVGMYEIEHKMPFKPAKSFQLACFKKNKAAPKQPPHFSKNIGHMSHKAAFLDNCHEPSKCSKWWASWLPGDSCKDYCKGKKPTLYYNYRRLQRWLGKFWAKAVLLFD